MSNLLKPKADLEDGRRRLAQASDERRPTSAQKPRGRAYVVLVAKWAKFAPPPPFLSFDFTAGFDVGERPCTHVAPTPVEESIPANAATWSACDFGWGGTEQWGTTFDIRSSTH
jgi:hypothetical protein